MTSLWGAFRSTEVINIEGVNRKQEAQEMNLREEIRSDFPKVWGNPARFPKKVFPDVHGALDHSSIGFQVVDLELGLLGHLEDELNPSFPWYFGWSKFNSEARSEASTRSWDTPNRSLASRFESEPRSQGYADHVLEIPVELLLFERCDGLHISFSRCNSRLIPKRFNQRYADRVLKLRRCKLELETEHAAQGQFRPILSHQVTHRNQTRLDLNIDPRPSRAAPSRMLPVLPVLQDLKFSKPRSLGKGFSIESSPAQPWLTRIEVPQLHYQVLEASAVTIEFDPTQPWLPRIKSHRRWVRVRVRVRVRRWEGGEEGRGRQGRGGEKAEKWGVDTACIARPAQTRSAGPHVCAARAGTRRARRTRGSDVHTHTAFASSAGASARERRVHAPRRGCVVRWCTRGRAHAGNGDGDVVRREGMRCAIGTAGERGERMGRREVAVSACAGTRSTRRQQCPTRRAAAVRRRGAGTGVDSTAGAPTHDVRGSTRTTSARQRRPHAYGVRAERGRECAQAAPGTMPCACDSACGKRGGKGAGERGERTGTGRCCDEEEAAMSGASKRKQCPPGSGGRDDGEGRRMRRGCRVKRTEGARKVGKAVTDDSAVDGSARFAEGGIDGIRAWDSTRREPRAEQIPSGYGAGFLFSLRRVPERKEKEEVEGGLGSNVCIWVSKLSS
ncbi:hypothetical protein B0H16DRAFT_1773224 [Mycena metata]|uniref:Uncharacterized protein n=1 Tax=Mycena metata TaxID=1033252 RepID=A0AAD7MSI6_9AGAR|nr:hypothetical protein B0H16DRAFT_1773224 [Mycena metata]